MEGLLSIQPTPSSFPAAGLHDVSFLALIDCNVKEVILFRSEAN